MPCRDDSYPSPYTENLQAMLCGIVKVLARKNTLNPTLAAVDWTDAGVTRLEFEQWWEVHQQHDIARQKYEAKQRLQEKYRVDALKKLSPEERVALGV